MNTINPNSASLSFRVKFETTYGQSVYIIGSIEELGQWDTSKAVQRGGFIAIQSCLEKQISETNNLTYRLNRRYQPNQELFLFFKDKP